MKQLICSLVNSSSPKDIKVDQIVESLSTFSIVVHIGWPLQIWSPIDFNGLRLPLRPTYETIGFYGQSISGENHWITSFLNNTTDLIQRNQLWIKETNRTRVEVLFHWYFSCLLMSAFEQRWTGLSGQASMASFLDKLWATIELRIAAMHVHYPRHDKALVNTCTKVRAVSLCAICNTERHDLRPHSSF